jgi:CRP-like cAMP-binding protein
MNLHLAEARVTSRDCEKQQLLAGLDLFSKLRSDELRRLATYARWSTYPATRVLFRKGDPGSRMMVVRHGRVKACTHSEEGKELMIAMFRPGEVFGEIALLDGADRTADIVAIEDCELLTLDRRDFIPFLLEHPEAAVTMLEVLARRVRRTTKLLEDVAFYDGPIRLARRLVHLAEVVGVEVEEGVRLDMPLSQQQLGNMVGMTRETINKQLKQWREEALITWVRSIYTITDLAALKKISVMDAP